MSVLTTTIDHFLDLAALGRPRPAIEYADGLADQGLGVRDLIDELLVPTQREVGRLWQTNQWTVAQEHAATSVIDGVLSAVARRTPTNDSTDRRVVVACVEGEYHSMPPRMGAEQLRAAGWDVIFLGASVPREDLRNFVTATEPHAVVLSCTIPLHLLGTRRCIDALADLAVPVVAAGAAFGTTPRRARRLGATGWIGPTDDASEVLDGPLGTPRTAPHSSTAAMRLAVGITDWLSTATATSARPAHSDGVLEALVHEMTLELPQYLALALELDDRLIYSDHVRWARSVLASRGAPGNELDTTLDLIEHATSALDQPEARALARSCKHQPPPSR